MSCCFTNLIIQGFLLCGLRLWGHSLLIQVGTAPFFLGIFAQATITTLNVLNCASFGNWRQSSTWRPKFLRQLRLFWFLVNFTFISNLMNWPVLQNALRQVCLKGWSRMDDDWNVGLSSHKSIGTVGSINLSLSFGLGWPADQCKLLQLEYEAWIRFCAFPFYNPECILAI